MPVRRMLDQERAAAAWSAVQTVVTREAKLQGEYRALARGFAAMIQINGFGPACAFLFAKSKSTEKNRSATAHALLLAHLQSWLRQHFLSLREQQPLIDWLTAATTTSDEYRRATIEVFAYLVWLSRFAEGALAAPEQEGSDGATPGKEHV